VCYFHSKVTDRLIRPDLEVATRRNALLDWHLRRAAAERARRELAVAERPEVFVVIVEIGPTCLEHGHRLDPLDDHVVCLDSGGEPGQLIDNRKARSRWSPRVSMTPTGRNRSRLGEDQVNRLRSWGPGCSERSSIPGRFRCCSQCPGKRATGLPLSRAATLCRPQCWIRFACGDI
jgi:hypothetical protein